MKAIKYLVAVAFIALLSVGMTSCGGYSPKAVEQMVEKFDGGNMTKGDYEKCMGWVEKYYDENLKEFEKCIDDSKNEKQFGKAVEKAGEEFEKKWEDIEEIITLLNQAAYDEDKEFGKSNIKKWEKMKEDFDKKSDKLYEKASKKFDK